MTAVGSFFRQNWVLAGEHFALRASSFALSMVSAHAILWFFLSMAMVQDADPFQRFVPYVIAGAFGLLGYFVSRGLVYRMMRKERIRVYIVVVLLFEFVEVVCNFAQAVSSVPHVDWLSQMRGGLHDGLSALLYIAYSIVPVATFVVAVVNMDLEKEKSSAVSRVPLTLHPTVVPPRASGAPLVPRGQIKGQPGVMPSLPPRPVVVGVPPNQSTVKGQAAAASSSGWNFPYAKTTPNRAASEQEGNGVRRDAVVLS